MVYGVRFQQTAIGHAAADPCVWVPVAVAGAVAMQDITMADVPMWTPTGAQAHTSAHMSRHTHILRANATIHG